jgi:hypothetical protein
LPERIVDYLRGETNEFGNRKAGSCDERYEFVPRE